MYATIEEIKSIKFDNIEEMAEVLKGLSADEVIGLAKLLGLKWEENDNVRINRMRASIAIRKHFFPGQRRPKKVSPWKKFSIEELIKIAESHGLQWRRSENYKINRMRVTMALKKAGIVPPEK